MKKSIETLRADIEKIHEQLLMLMMKRKDLVDQIWGLKHTQKMDVDDLARERALVEQFDQRPELKNDPAFQEFYHNVVKNIISENKRYAKKRIPR